MSLAEYSCKSCKVSFELYFKKSGKTPKKAKCPQCGINVPKDNIASMGLGSDFRPFFDKDLQTQVTGPRNLRDEMWKRGIGDDHIGPSPTPAKG